MNKKGFTLIELLAVIVILGIIAVITTSKVNDSIEISRKSVAINSAYNYAKAVQQYVYHEAMNKNNITLNGTYNINNGKLRNYQIEFSGTTPTGGFLSYSNNDLVRGCISINGYALVFEGNEITSATKELCDNYVSGYDLPQISTTGDGLYASPTNSGRYIYRGANPNNYIWLDENGDGNRISTEIYRIISFESDGSIKVIRNNSIGSMAWDKIDENDITTGPRKNDNNTYCNYTASAAGYNGCNVWGTQANTYYNSETLSNLSQNFYFKYYEDNTSTLLQNSSNTGTVTKNSSLNEYLNHLIENEEYWTVSENLDEYITEHKFYVGGVWYMHEVFEYTGGDKGIVKEKEEESVYTWNGKIGLINITEYVEASTNPSCVSVYSNYYYNPDYYYDTDNDGQEEQTILSYNDWPCSNTNYNWMATGIKEWTLTAASGNRSNIWYINSSGEIRNYSSRNTNEVRPVFYIDSAVSFSGRGTESNPYYIINS